MPRRCFLPVKSVGVVGDNRAYDYVFALRAVETVDFSNTDVALFGFRVRLAVMLGDKQTVTPVPG